jgi:hypothetical protein
VWIDLQQGDIAEQDLKDLLQASYQAGYKMSVNSPEGMPGVEGLTHDHLVEISAGVYMKFKHAYAVGQVDEKNIILLDPHGKSENEDYNIYSSDLSKNIENLHNEFELLEKQLKSSSYGSFSTQVRESLNEIFEQLNSYSDVSSIGILISKWKRLLNRKEIKEGEEYLSGINPLAGESFLKQINKHRMILKKEDIGKGFLKRKEQVVEGQQKISYKAMRQNFESIKINRIY